MLGSRCQIEHSGGLAWQGNGRRKDVCVHPLTVLPMNTIITIVFLCKPQAVLKNLKPSVSPEEITRYIEYDKKHGVRIMARAAGGEEESDDDDW